MQLQRYNLCGASTRVGLNNTISANESNTTAGIQTLPGAQVYSWVPRVFSEIHHPFDNSSMSKTTAPREQQKGRLSKCLHIGTSEARIRGSTSKAQDGVTSAMGVSTSKSSATASLAATKSRRQRQWITWLTCLMVNHTDKQHPNLLVILT